MMDSKQEETRMREFIEPVKMDAFAEPSFQWEGCGESIQAIARCTHGIIKRYPKTGLAEEYERAYTEMLADHELLEKLNARGPDKYFGRSLSMIDPRIHTRAIKAALWTTHLAMRDHIIRFKVYMSESLVDESEVEQAWGSAHKVCGYAFNAPGFAPYVYFGGIDAYPKYSTRGEVKIPRGTRDRWVRYYFPSTAGFPSEKVRTFWPVRAVNNCWALLYWLDSHPEVVGAIRPWIQYAITLGRSKVYSSEVELDNILPNCASIHTVGVGEFTTRVAAKEYDFGGVPGLTPRGRELVVIMCWVLRTLGMLKPETVRYWKHRTVDKCHFSGGTPEQKQILMNAFPGVVI